MNWPNTLTLSRLVFAVVFVFLLTQASWCGNIFALLVFIIASLTDFYDGFLAKRRGLISDFGKIMDPIADKILLVSAFICLSLVNNLPPNLKLPAYVPIIVISRDAIIVLGSVIVYFIKGDVKIEPSIWGKVTTFFQMITIVSILIQFKYSFYISF